MIKNKFAENGRSVSIEHRTERPKSWRMLNAFMLTVGEPNDLVRMMPRLAKQNFNALCIRGEKTERTQKQTQELYDEAAKNGLVLFEECVFDADGHNLECDEGIDAFVAHEVIPKVTRMRERAIAKDDRTSTLNLYLPEPEKLLRPERDWEAGHVWWKIAKAVTPLCASKNGAKPEFMLGTSDEPVMSLPVIQAFPQEMQKHLHHTTSAMPGMLEDKPSVFDMLKNVSRHNYHGVYERHHQDRMILGDNQVATTGGAAFPQYLRKGLWDGGHYTIARKVMMFSTLLPTRSYGIEYGENRNHFHMPNDPAKAKKLDMEEVDPDGDAERFITDLNATKKSLYELHDGYFWNEMAFSWAHPDHALQIFWPKPGFLAEPVLVLMDTQKAGWGRDVDPAVVAHDLYRQNAFDKRHPQLKPEAIFLIGPNKGLNQAKIAEDYGAARLILNGRELTRPQGQQVAYEQASEGLYLHPNVA